jgi:ankyrin repeat protein
MDARKLPARPSLEQYRKQAKELVKGFRSGDGEAVRRVQRSRRSESKEGPAEISLADAQLVIAREHGFASWPKFVGHIKGLTSRDSLVCDFELAVEAIITGDVAALRYLLKRNPELIRARSTRTHRATLLHYTAANGVEDFLQRTPKNIVAITEFLLKAGAEVDATADMYGGGATTLGLAVTSVHPFLAGVQNELADVLLKYGADINRAQGAGNGQRPINGCLANGRPEAAEHLAKRGARLDLEAAAGVGRVDEVKSFFTPVGILKGATDYELRSGFKWACAYGRMEVVKFLVETNIDINALHRGETPLHWAAYGGHGEIVQLLLRHRARTEIRDETFGGTPLGWAVYGWGESKREAEHEKYYEIVELLVGAGARIDRNWLNEKDRGFPLDKMIASDLRMRRVLGSSVFSDG